MRRLMTELPSRVINRWQVEGGDLAILPVGSTEALGPHLPLGGRTFAAEAFAKLLAEEADGLYLPALPLTPAFETTGQPGTIDVSEPPVNRMIRAIMDDMLATGFRRIVLVTYLDYARYYVPVEFYEDHEVAAAGMSVNEAIWKLVESSEIDNDSVILGALKILGRDDLVAKCLDAAARWKARKRTPAAPTAATRELQRFGFPAFRHPKGYYPMPPADVIDPDAGAEVLREAVRQKAPALEDLRAYNDYLTRRHDRGMMRGGQFKNS